MKDLKTAGELQPGVLIDRIYQRPAVAPPSLQTATGIPIALFPGPAEELGFFVKRWFKEKRKHIYGAAKNFQGGFIELFRRGLATVLRAETPRDARVMSRRLKNSLMFLMPSFEKVTAVAKANSSTDSSSEDERLQRIRNEMGRKIESILSDFDDTCREFKRITKMLTKMFGAGAEEMCDKLEAFMHTPEAKRLSSQELRNLREKLKKLISSSMSTTPNAAEAVQEEHSVDWAALADDVNQLINLMIKRISDKARLSKSLLNRFAEVSSSDEAEHGGSSSSPDERDPIPNETNAPLRNLQEIAQRMSAAAKQLSSQPATHGALWNALHQESKQLLELAQRVEATVRQKKQELEPNVPGKTDADANHSFGGTAKPP